MVNGLNGCPKLICAKLEKFIPGHPRSLVGIKPKKNTISSAHAQSIFVHRSQLNCLFFNAQSLVNKLDEFLLLLSGGSYDIIFVVETWLSNTVTDAMLVGQSPYNVTRRDRGSRAGGILVAVKKGINYVIMNTSEDTEALTIDLTTDKIVITVGYIPNGKDVEVVTKMCDYINSVNRGNRTNLVVGDFNQPLIDWANSGATGQTGIHIFNCFSDLGLEQLVTEPTRGDNILDLVLVDNERTVTDVRVLEGIGNSDHSMVGFNIQSRELKKLTPPCRKKRKINFRSLKLSLQNIDWDFWVGGQAEVDTMWQTFLTILNHNVELNSKVKRCNANNSKHLPNEVRKIRSRKKSLWQAYRKNKCPATKLRYKQGSIAYSACVRRFTIMSEKKVIEEGNLSALFRLVKNKTGIARSIPPLKINDEILSDDQVKANTLNNVFSRNFVPDDGNIPIIDINKNRDSFIDNVSFTIGKITAAINATKNSHAVGPDGFSAFFYKELRDEVAFPLLYIFKCSMQTGKLPACWKEARVIPVLKKGNASDPHNYRPISLTSVPCKIMERIIRNEILIFLTKNEIISDDQFGFMPGRSTTLQLLDVVNDWTRSLDEGFPVDVVLVDFAKAFDSVVHKKLLMKLENLGFTGRLLEWISDFLVGRRQRVVVGEKESDVVPVNSGVPQGSVLGPILFTIFLNDLSSKSDNVKINKFADDVKLHSAIRQHSNSHTLLNELDVLKNWSNLWQLPISDNKCKVFHIGNKNQLYDYSLSGSNLEHLTKVKDLGVWFTSDLKSTNHCNAVIKLATQRAAIIRRCFTSGDVSTLIWAFKVYVRPIVEYASPVWSPFLRGDIDRLERVQRKFTKSLPGFRDKSYETRLKMLKLDSLELRRAKADLAFTYCLLHGLLDYDPSNFFEIRNEGRTRGHPLKLVKKSFKLNCRKFFFANRVINMWNALPGDVVMAPSIQCFKTRLNKCDSLNLLLINP